MYHDEFLKKPVRLRPFPKEARPGFEVSLGGGVSLGLAASLNPSISLVVYYLGGLLPLVVCSLEIAARRALDTLRSLSPTLPPRIRHAVPVPHHLTASRIKARAPRVFAGPRR